MNYSEQLNSIDWKNKRTTIVSRDKLKCQNCFNQSYQNYGVGLIFGNGISHDSSPTSLVNDKYVIHLWDLENDIIHTGFINDEKFNDKKSNIAFYRKQGKYAQILALKAIKNKQIKINKPIKIQFGIRGKVDEETYNRIYTPFQKDDEWRMVYGLHVHHKYYQEGLMAWEYPDDALVTLCWECHEKLHEETTVPILDFQGNELGKYTNCKRCYGAGIFPEYYHVESGICFRCGGARFEELI